MVSATTPAAALALAAHIDTTSGKPHSGSGLVTVVPFSLSLGCILVPDVEIDGVRGTVLFDTGMPMFYLNAKYMPQGHSSIFVRTLRMGTLVQHFDASHSELSLLPGMNAFTMDPATIRDFCSSTALLLRL